MGAAIMLGIWFLRSDPWERLLWQAPDRGWVKTALLSGIQVLRNLQGQTPVQVLALAALFQWIEIGVI
jgi:hypothetical protein